MLIFYEMYLLKNALKIPKTKTQQKDPAGVVRDAALGVRLGSTEKHNWWKDLLKHQSKQPKNPTTATEVLHLIFQKTQKHSSSSVLSRFHL